MQLRPWTFDNDWKYETSTIKGEQTIGVGNTKQAQYNGGKKLQVINFTCAGPPEATQAVGGDAGADKRID